MVFVYTFLGSAANSFFRIITPFRSQIPETAGRYLPESYFKRNMMRNFGSALETINFFALIVDSWSAALPSQEQLGFLRKRLKNLQDSIRILIVDNHIGDTEECMLFLKHLEGF